MASGVFDKDTSWTCSSGMRLKWKSQAVIPFSQLCLWLKRLYYFLRSVLKPKNTTWSREKTPKPTDLFHIQHGNVVSTQSTRSNPTLTSGGKGWTNDNQKLWTCWCAGSGLRLSWITRWHTALMWGEEGKVLRWRRGGTKKGGGGGHYVQVRGGGWRPPSSAAAEAFQSWPEWTENDNKGMWLKSWEMRLRQKLHLLCVSHLLKATVQMGHFARFMN